jgi:hypothetical protein
MGAEPFNEIVTPLECRWNKWFSRKCRKHGLEHATLQVGGLERKTDLAPRGEAIFAA